MKGGGYGGNRPPRGQISGGLVLARDMLLAQPTSAISIFHLFPTRQLPLDAKFGSVPSRDLDKSLTRQPALAPPMET